MKIQFFLKSIGQKNQVVTTIRAVLAACAASGAKSPLVAMTSAAKPKPEAWRAGTNLGQLEIHLSLCLYRYMCIYIIIYVYITI